MLDIGLVILHKSSNTYYCGLNKWDKQLRKAKIYHKEKYLREWLESYCKSNGESIKDYIMCEIEIKEIGRREIV